MTTSTTIFYLLDQNENLYLELEGGPDQSYLFLDFCQTHWIIVTTPTQPQLNSKVGVDMKMTLHHKLNVTNISGVPDPILNKL